MATKGHTEHSHRTPAQTSLERFGFQAHVLSWGSVTSALFWSQNEAQNTHTEYPHRHLTEHTHKTRTYTLEGLQGEGVTKTQRSTIKVGGLLLLLLQLILLLVQR